MPRSSRNSDRPVRTAPARSSYKTRSSYRKKGSNAPKTDPEDFAGGFVCYRGPEGATELEWRGDPLPEWLNGSYLRNGPGRYELGPGEGGGEFRHFFDGLALLCGVALHTENGRTRARLQTAFLNSRDARASRQRGQPACTAFGTAPRCSWLQRLYRTLSPSAQFGANNSIHFQPLAGELAAIADPPTPVAFDPVSLETLGERSYADHRGLMIQSPHPHLDFARGEIWNFGVGVGAGGPRYELFRQRLATSNDGTTAGERHSRKRLVAAQIPVRRPAYMHSFALAGDYALLVEHPYLLQPLQLATMALAGRSLSDCFAWRPERGLRIIAVHRESGAQRIWTAPAAFLFHTVNAFVGTRPESPGGWPELILDCSVYPDAGIIDDLFLERIRAGVQPSAAKLQRYILPPDSNEARVDVISKRALELPRIAYRSRNGRPYRRLYGTSSTARAGNARITPDALIRIDPETGRTRFWKAPGLFPGEPVFVPDPRGKREDDGVLLSLCYDGANRAACFVVLDARSMRERGRAPIPFATPFGLHGVFLPERADGGLDLQAFSY